MANQIKIETINYVWKGKDAHGKACSGHLNAKNLLLAKVNLKSQGYKIDQIGIYKKPLFSFKLQTIAPSDIAIFSRQLATLLKAGIPLVQALGIIGNGHKNQTLQTLLACLKSDIEKGETFAEALTKFPQYFNLLYCNLIAAGEHAGILDSLLDKIACYQEKTETLKKKIAKALIYPIVVMLVALIVTTLLLVFVIPIFDEMFKSLGAELPLFTRWVISISTWIITHWWLLLSGISVLIFSFYYCEKHHPAFTYFLDKNLLKLPIIGLLVNNSAIARFSRTLSTLSSAGVPLVDALQAVAGTCGNHVYYDAVLAMRDEVATGQRLQYAMQKTQLFPNLVQQMIAIGEESGSLDAMLNNIAEFYEIEVDNLVANLSALIEPLIMLVLGLLIGGLIIAMYLPIFKMGAAIA